jgi:hypothetical protein
VVQAEVVAPSFLNSPRYHFAILLGSLGVLLAACILQLAGTEGVRLPGSEMPLPEICYAKRNLGFSCPGCGLTRSTISMMRGDLGAAWAFNPMGPVLFVLIVAQLPYRLWAIRRSKQGRMAELPGTNWLAFAILLGLIGQWIVGLLIAS